MGGKRGNENAQMRREEYEAMEASSGNDKTPSGGFVKASSEVLGRRKILKATSQWKQSAAKAGSGMAGASTSSNPFTNFSFTKNTATSTAPNDSNKALPPPPSGKPMFAMPTLPLPTATAPTEEDKKLALLTKNFKAYVANLDVHKDWSLPMERYVTTFLSIRKGGGGGSSQEKTHNRTSTTTNSTAGTTATPVHKPLISSTTTTTTAPSSSSSSTPDKPLFPAVSGESPKVAFSFDNGNNTKKPTFTFGTPAAATTTTTTTSSASGFSFAPNVASSSTGTASKSPNKSPTTTTTNTTTTTSTTKTKNDNEDGVLESADDDWTLVAGFKIKIYHHRSPEQQMTKFAMGTVKLQQQRQNDKNRRMVMRDATGKVLLNLAISKGMTFSKQVQAGKKGNSVATIKFFGLREVGRDPELLTINCKVEDVEELHKTLETMAS